MAISASTAAAITAVVAVAGAAASAYAMKRQSDIASDTAEREATAQRLQGELAQENARMAAAEKQTEAQRVASAQVVAGGGSGISLNSGALLTLMDETSSMYEADRQQLLRTGKLQHAAATYSAKTSALGASRTAGYFQAGGTLLSGVSTGMVYGEKAGWFD